MFRNYLAAAFRNFARNEVYAGLTVAGLAIGFAAAILIALFVRDELTWDHFVPGYKDIYQVTITVRTTTLAPEEASMLNAWTGQLLQARFPEARVARASPPYAGRILVRHGQVRAAESDFWWVDPSYFRIFRMPAIAGDPASALDRPDAVVLARTTARRYFGRDAPIGETLLVDTHPMQVAAVIADPPSNTDLSSAIYASSLAPFSAINLEEKSSPVGDLSFSTETFLQLPSPAAAARIRTTLPAFYAREMPPPPALVASSGVTVTPHLIPLSSMHLRGSIQFGRDIGDAQVVIGIALVGVLIVAVAAINFVIMMTARANRRAVEVGVRKAAGARRGDLVVQFLSETMIYVAVAMLAAVALAELTLPAVDGFLGRTISFDYLRDPWLAVGIPGVAAATGVAAGLYPALVLSAFKPAAVLRGAVGAVGSGRVRQALVVAQFGVLIGLMVVTATIARQVLFGLDQVGRVDGDRVVVGSALPCEGGFRDAVAALPGVNAAVCANGSAIGQGRNIVPLRSGERRVDAEEIPVNFGLFELYRIQPLAGRLFSRDHPVDAHNPDPSGSESVILNETAVRKFGLGSAGAAIGKTVYWDAHRSGQVIGVVPDFSFDTVRLPVAAAFFFVGGRDNLDTLNVRLNSGDAPATVRAIDAAWDRLGGGEPLVLSSLSQMTLKAYGDLIDEGVAVAVASALAVAIACLGLFALSAFSAEQRRTEIGVRKAMGAGVGDVLRLMLWSFTRAVLLANLIAWPVAWWLMSRWLDGFAYHAPLGVLTFIGASLLAVLIAWATVAVQSLVAARIRPADALRYE
jgi:putative ABC transport system permease protein